MGQDGAVNLKGALLVLVVLVINLGTIIQCVLAGVVSATVVILFLNAPQASDQLNNRKLHDKLRRIIIGILELLDTSDSPDRVDVAVQYDGPSSVKETSFVCVDTETLSTCADLMVSDPNDINAEHKERENHFNDDDDDDDDACSMKSLQISLIGKSQQNVAHMQQFQANTVETVPKCESSPLVSLEEDFDHLSLAASDDEDLCMVNDASDILHCSVSLTPACSLNLISGKSQQNVAHMQQFQANTVETVPKCESSPLVSLEEDFDHLSLAASDDDEDLCMVNDASDILHCSVSLTPACSLNLISEDESMLISLHSSPVSLFINQAESPPENGHSEEFSHILDAYYAIYNKSHMLTFVSGCLIDNNCLHVLINDNYDLKDCHKQIINVIPMNVKHHLVHVRHISEAFSD